jgi:hypothetical protein
LIRGSTGSPQFFFNALHYWMPDQVRHDGQKLSAFLNYDTVWQTGVQFKKAWIPACAGMTNGKVIQSGYSAKSCGGRVVPKDW